jgi:hypothetical protein
MNQELKTLEVARIYETQGYFEEALEIYSFLESRKSSDEVKADLKRMEKRMEDKDKDLHVQEKISGLYQEWLALMILKNRLDNLKKLKSSCL